tara:strand:+ start:399 stop:617 length:219 start_codon:yes stop_codon:yes gene_type:complete
MYTSRIPTHRLWGCRGVADKKNARGVGTPEWGSNADADRTIIEAVATLNGLPPLLMAAVGVGPPIGHKLHVA